MTNSDKKIIEDFKKDLKELLDKYNATIVFNCSDDSDLYGIHDERISAEIKGIDGEIVLGKYYSVDKTDL